MNISYEKVSSEFLELNSCNQQFLSDKNYTLHRKNGRSDYHILYITEGCCYTLDQGREVRVPAGHLILFKPREEQLYKFYAVDHPVSCYIHFSGTGCESLLKELGLNNRITCVGQSHTLSRIFLAMRDEHLLHKPYYKQTEAALLLSFLSHAARRARYAFENLDPAAVTRMDEICRHMHKHYRDNHTVEFYAKKSGLSIDRFSHAFKESTGVSPKQYMLQIKVDMARELLQHSSFTITDIADAVGIDDVSYFTKLIKRYTGHTPSYFRS